MIQLYITNYEIAEPISNMASKHTTIRKEYKYFLENGSSWEGEFEKLSKDNVVITICLKNNVTIEFPRVMTLVEEKTIIYDQDK